MTLVTEDIVIPQHTETRERFRLCELCGNKGSAGGEWATSLYDVDETTIENGVGEHCDGSGHRDVAELDICGECFRTKLIPWFEAQGGKPRTKRIEY
jgi:hypothetical protein